MNEDRKARTLAAMRDYLHGRGIGAKGRGVGGVLLGARARAPGGDGYAKEQKEEP